jgi:peptidoglycan/xylan/chitin deacetylase (PgdA/CDA1 family)
MFPIKHNPLNRRAFLGVAAAVPLTQVPLGAGELPTLSPGMVNRSATVLIPAGVPAAQFAPNGVGCGGGVVIHYDDANRSDYTKAFPVHKELGLPGISLVNTGPMDGRSTKLTWDQAREMRDSGLWSIGNHCREHRRLTELTIAEARAQIESGYATILAQMGEPPLWFVAPYHDTNKNVEIMSSRLHARSRSLASASGSQGGYTFLSSPVDSWFAGRYPGGLSELPKFLNDLYFRTVVGGDIVHVLIHEITPTNVDNGNYNIGETEHRALLQGIRDRNIPVLDARALAYPRLNLLEDPSFELGGQYLTPVDYNGTAVVSSGKADAHSGSSYLRLTTAGATGSGPAVRLPATGLPVHVTRDWRFTCWVRASRASGGRFYIHVERSTGLSGVPISTLILTANNYDGQPATTGWQRFTTTFDMTGYNEARIYLGARASEAVSVSVDIDSMSLIPSFEYDINGETVA